MQPNGGVGGAATQSDAFSQVSRISFLLLTAVASRFGAATSRVPQAGAS